MNIWVPLKVFLSSAKISQSADFVWKRQLVKTKSWYI